MKKSKFILGILAAVMCTAYADVNITYTAADSSTGLRDAVMTIKDDNSNGYTVYTAGIVGGVTKTSGSNAYSEIPTDFTVSSPDNAFTPTTRPIEVRNSVINLESGYVDYLIGGSNGDGAVHGTRTINMTGGKVDWLFGGVSAINDAKPAAGYYCSNPDKRPVKTTEKVTINVSGGTITRFLAGGGILSAGSEYLKNNGGLSAFAVGGDVDINISGDAAILNEKGDKINGGGDLWGSVDGKVTFNISGNAYINADIYGGARGALLDDEGNVTDRAYVGSAEITISESAHITKSIYGGSSYTGGGGGSGYIKGDTMVTIEGGTIDGNVYAGGDKDLIKGNAQVILKGGKIKGGVVYGSGTDGSTIEGRSTVQILSGDWSQTKVYAQAEGATVKGGTELIVGAEGIAYNGELGSIAGFDRVTVAKGSNLNLQAGNVFDVAEHTYTITSASLGTEGLAVTAISPDAEVKVVKPITLNFNTEGRVISGRYKIIDASAADAANVDTTTNWDSEHVTVTGQGVSFDGLVWEGNVLYIDYVSPVVGNVVSGNWGVFKSSQAFTGTLWGNRANACVLSTPAQQPCTDAKGNYIPAAAPTGTTLAWGTVYGQSARISGVGADYSVYGGAVGVEHQFVSGRSIGSALGYDWGEVSPYGQASIDQESFHAAVYGRAGIWQLGANSAVAVDLSAAYGSTESDTAMVPGDWQQDSLQLDARVSYLRQLGASTTGSVFAGVQYFAADSDTVDGMEISSMQNLRTEIGAGVSHKATENTTVYGEISVYNDAMRHNPYVADGGNRYYGTNPGRLGGSISVGAQYDLNDNWSVRGSYSFDAADDSTEHNLNAGAVYKF